MRDWKTEFRSIKTEVENLNIKFQKEYETLNNKANELAQAYAEAEDFTKRFLTMCSRHHIKLVSIGTRTSRIEEARDWPFDCANSVFASGTDREGWPTIWKVVEKLDIGGGAGNTGQHQITRDAKLIEGVYEFKDKKWHKIE